MRLLKDNSTILLTAAEREHFFAVYSPQTENPESIDRVVLTDMDEADWLKFVFESKAEESGGEQGRIWSRAAELLAQMRARNGWLTGSS